MTKRLPVLLVLMSCSFFGACSSLFRNVPDERPPLADMDEPLGLFDEPDDEEVRNALPAGAFSGIYVDDTAASLDDLFEESIGLTVEDVVENSPAAFAGIEPGDILLEATAPGRDTVELQWPSQWREIELKTAPGTAVVLLTDRAGVERETTVTLEKRLVHPERTAAERFREEARVGVVLRSATEVEARRAGLPPGAGAVVVGLSRASPWRAAGVKFGDLIASIGEKRVDHPRVILDEIRATDPGESVAVVVWRGDQTREVALAVTQRDHDMHEVNVPPLYSYESERGKSEWSILYGFLGYEETQAAWRFKLLWFITFGGGDADELETVDEPVVAEPQP